MIKIHESIYSQRNPREPPPKTFVAAGLFSLIVCSTIYLTAYLEGSEAADSGPVIKLGKRRWFAGKRSSQCLYFPSRPAGFLSDVFGHRHSNGRRKNGSARHQRMTPMNPFSKIIGYILASSLANTMFFFTSFPWARNFGGKIATGKHHSIVFCFLLFCHPLPPHCTCSGFVVPKPRAASWVSRIVVLGLYVVLPGLGQAEYLSFFPTILPTYW